MTVFLSSAIFLPLSALFAVPASSGALPPRQEPELPTLPLLPGLPLPINVPLPVHSEEPEADLETVTTNVTWDGQPVTVDVDVADLVKHFQAALDEDEEDPFDGDVEAAATKLVEHSGCSDNEKKLLYAGWKESWKIMNNLNEEMELDGINLNEASAVEYLGPPVYTKTKEKNLIDLYGRWGTIQPGYIGTIFDWRLHVRCDDPSNKCKDPCDKDPRNRGPYAYTSNKDVDSGLARINFCPRYFQTPSLKDAVKNGNDPDLGVSWQYDVGSYLMNKAHIWAHELMHVDWAVNAGDYGDQSRVTDIRMRVVVLDGSTKTIKAYQPQAVKALARYAPDTADYTIRNADSLSLYALVRYLQRKVLSGVYPHLPLAPAPPSLVENSLSNDNLQYAQADARGWNLFDNGTVTIAPLHNLWSDIDLNSECSSSAGHSPDENVDWEADDSDEDGDGAEDIEVALESFVTEEDLGEDYLEEFNKWTEDFYNVPCVVPSGCENVSADGGCAVVCYQ